MIGEGFRVESLGNIPLTMQVLSYNYSVSQIIYEILMPGHMFGI